MLIVIGNGMKSDWLSIRLRKQFIFFRLTALLEFFNLVKSIRFCLTCHPGLRRAKFIVFTDSL